MADNLEKDKHFVFGSNLYKEYCEKKEQIMKYKWIESEKQGRDIGIERAWLQWESRYYSKWKDTVKEQDKKNPPVHPNDSGK